MSVFQFRKKAFDHSDDDDDNNDDDNDDNNSDDNGAGGGSSSDDSDFDTSKANKRGQGTKRRSIPAIPAPGKRLKSGGDGGSSRGNSSNSNSNGNGNSNSNKPMVIEEDDILFVDEKKILREIALSKEKSRKTTVHSNSAVTQQLLNSLAHAKELLSKEVIIEDLTDALDGDPSSMYDSSSSSSSSSRPAAIEDKGVPTELQMRINGGVKEVKSLQVLSDMKFVKLKNFLVSYFSLKGSSDVKIVFDGMSIKDNDSCEDLDIEDSDMLDVTVPKEKLVALTDFSSRWNSFKSHKPDAAALPPLGGGAPIAEKSVNIKTRFNGTTTKQIKYSKSRKFEVLTKFLASHCNCPEATVKIQFDGDNIRGESCDSLDIDDGDMIDISIPKDKIASITTFDEQWLAYVKNGYTSSAPMMAAPAKVAIQITLPPSPPAVAAAAVATTANNNTNTTAAAKKGSKNDNNNKDMVNISFSIQFDPLAPPVIRVGRFMKTVTIQDVRDWIVANNIVSSNFEILYSQGDIKNLLLLEQNVLDSYKPNVGSGKNKSYELVLMPLRMKLNIKTEHFMNSKTGFPFNPIQFVVRSINNFGLILDNIAKAYGEENFVLELPRGAGVVTKSHRTKTLADFGIHDGDTLRAIRT